MSRNERSVETVFLSVNNDALPIHTREKLSLMIIIHQKIIHKD